MTSGLADDLELWAEYEQASRGRRQMTLSRDLRKWAGLGVERSDEEVAAEDRYGVTTIMLPGVTWVEVRPRADELLTVAELGGIEAAQRWLDRRGLVWFIPNPRGIDDG